MELIVYAGSASSNYWSNTSNATGNNDSTSASYGGAITYTRGITLSNFDISSLPDNAIISKVDVSVRHNVSNTSRGDINASCSLGSLTLTETTTKHTNTTTFTDNITKESLQNFSLTFNNYRTSTSTYTTYLYWASLTITYEEPIIEEPDTPEENPSDNNLGIVIGNNKIKEIRVGNIPIKKVMVGNISLK